MRNLDLRWFEDERSGLIHAADLVERINNTLRLQPIGLRTTHQFVRREDFAHTSPLAMIELNHAPTLVYYIDERSQLLTAGELLRVTRKQSADHTTLVAVIRPLSTPARKNWHDVITREEQGYDENVWRFLHRIAPLSTEDAR